MGCGQFQVTSDLSGSPETAGPLEASFMVLRSFRSRALGRFEGGDHLPSLLNIAGHHHLATGLQRSRGGASFRVVMASFTFGRTRGH